jgi:hypothetical protein
MESLLFDFPDFGLSDDESEPTLSLASLSHEDEEDKEDKWYNMPSDSDSDLDNRAPSAPLYPPPYGVVLQVHLLLEPVLLFARSILLALELGHLLY